VGLRDYLDVLRRRLRLIVVSLLVVGLSAFVVSAMQPPIYASQAQVVVGQQDAGTSVLGMSLPDQAQVSEQGIQTQVQLMSSSAFLRLVIDKLGLRTTVEDLSQRISVSEVGLTSLVIVRASAPTPQEAADIANALAQRYVDWSREQQVASIKAAATEVEVSLGQLAQRIASLVTTAAQDSTGVKQQELATGRSLYGSLTEKLNQMKISESLATGSGRIFEAATPDPLKVSPQPLLATGLGLLAGLIIGIGGAFTADALDNRVVSEATALELYGAPVLGRIPAQEARRGTPNRAAVLEQPDGPAAESYRSLRNNLDFIDFEHKTKVLLITSATPAEGKSTTAANLATVLSQAGSDVILVTCDFRKPAADMLFDVTNEIGLSDVLFGSVSLDSALQHPADLPKLRILAAGPTPPNPSELLGSERMGSLVAELRERAQWVILDTPPILAVSDAGALARWSDAVLVVARSGKSRREAARRAREDLDRVGASLLGVVLVGAKADPLSHSYYGYYSSSR